MVNNMRVWLVDPRIMCRMHLLGEHRELHALASLARKAAAGDSDAAATLEGHLSAGQVDVSLLVPRHQALVTEMARRGWMAGLDHQTPLTPRDVPRASRTGTIDPVESFNELTRRCGKCREMAVLLNSEAV